MPKSGARTVSLMTDQRAVFGHLTIPSVYSGEPGLLRYYANEGKSGLMTILHHLKSARDAIAVEWREGSVIGRQLVNPSRSRSRESRAGAAR